MSRQFDTATIKELVYRSLRQALIQQRYQPGEWLQENEIAERLGVSRSPVREALHMLAGDGLLVEIPKRGVYVRELSERDVRENFSLRCLLEVDAIHSLCADWAEPNAEELRACLRRERAAYSEMGDSWGEQAGESLHTLLLRLAGNATACRIHGSLRAQLMLIRISAIMSEGDAERSHVEHAAIVGHILEGQPERAAEADRAHLDRTQELVLAHTCNG